MRGPRRECEQNESHSLSCLILKVTYCDILLIRSKSLELIIFKARGLHSGVSIRTQDHWDHVRRRLLQMRLREDDKL